MVISHCSIKSLPVECTKGQSVFLTDPGIVLKIVIQASDPETVNIQWTGIVSRVKRQVS